MLASKSPRRQQLLSDLGLKFEVLVREVEEIVPEGMPVQAVATYLAEEKASAYPDLSTEKLVITADTIVCIDNRVLGKPENREVAIQMIADLSGRAHEVITGVCFTWKGQKKSFAEVTKVYFRNLSQAEIEFYVDEYQPYDKAGAYGIQEWIGMAGIEKIEGDYYNVMGLPTHRLYLELQNFISKE